MNNAHRLLAVLAILALAACSYALVDGPAPMGDPDRAASTATCTTSKWFVVHDALQFGLFTAAVVAVMSDPEDFDAREGAISSGTAMTLFAGIAVLAGTSALVGNERVNNCREALVDR